MDHFEIVENLAQEDDALTQVGVLSSRWWWAMWVLGKERRQVAKGGIQ